MYTMRALITGITGFVGSHLAEYILANHPDTQIFGIKRWRSPKDNIRGILNNHKVKIYDCDLRDLASLITVFSKIKPDVIFHLAAQSFVTTSYIAPGRHAGMQRHRHDKPARGSPHPANSIPVIHICSSSEVYGQVNRKRCADPRDVSAASRQPLRRQQSRRRHAGYMYSAAYGMKTIRTRMFTHSGPRRGEVFVDSFFSQQVARIELGLQDPVIRVGNLDTVRTFADVRDTVRAYWLLAQKCPPGEVYNIGGDITMTIREMLDMLLTMTNYKGKIEVTR